MKPLSLQCFNKHKKDNDQTLYLTKTFENQIVNNNSDNNNNNVCTLFLKDAIFRKLPHVWCTEKHKIISEFAKIAWNH